MTLFKKYALYFAWFIALIALFGSLYYGEILRFEPCRLCWYQRIAMFPLAYLLGLAFYKNDQKLALYCLPLVVFGAVVALYQSILQVVPSIKIGAICGEGAPCTMAGPAPYLSLLAFVLIGLIIILKNKF